MRHSIFPCEKLRTLRTHLLYLSLQSIASLENTPTLGDCLFLLSKGNQVLEEVQPEDD